MKILIAVAVVSGLLANHAFGQGAQADQIKRRARELNNQNNVRQGVAPPSQPPPKPVAPGTAKPATPGPAPTAQQSTAKLQAHLVGIKAGSPVTPEQKTQFIKDISIAVRGTTKPSLPAVAKFVNGLTAVLAVKPLGSADQARLAQDIEAVLNSAAMPVTKFDAVIADVQAILQVADAKRGVALAVASDLKSVGQEVRRPAR